MLSTFLKHTSSAVVRGEDTLLVLTACCLGDSTVPSLHRKEIDEKTGYDVSECT